MLVLQRLAGAVLVLFFVTSAPQAWSNGGKSTSANIPKFGTHDYIAFQGYKLAGRPDFIKQNLNAFFIGTEAPDSGKALFPSAAGTYADTLKCHCILFDVNGEVSKDRLEVRVQEEFDKAKAALASGNRKLAAFYAGAMAHYLGDLSQFCHIMGVESHWGSENKTVHSNYEKVVDKTIKFQTRSSSLLDPFIHMVSLPGTTARAVALSVALFAENGGAGADPRVMHTHYQTLMTKHKNTDPMAWDALFRDQTGKSINVSVNGVAKTLKMLP